MKLQPSPVQVAAEALGLHIRHPERLDDAATAALAALRPEFLIVVAYGQILSEAALAAASVAAINGHASLLPRWRGAAPIHRAIAAGDGATGVTAMYMVKALDAGPMLLKKQEKIHPGDTTASLHDRLAEVTADVLAETVGGFEALVAQPQNEAEVTWAEKITSAEAEMDFTSTSADIERRIRAFAPFPGAWIAVPSDAGEDLRLKVLEAKFAAGKGAPGDILPAGANGGPVIATADGAIELTLVQPQGKPKMDGRSFLNGHRLPPRISPSGGR